MPQLMTKEEIHEFGLQILSRYLEANAYEIEMMHPNMQMFPHVIAKKNGQLVFIIAATDCLLLRRRTFTPTRASSAMTKRLRCWRTPPGLTRRRHVLILALPMRKARRTRTRNCAARLIKMLTF